MYIAFFSMQLLIRRCKNLSVRIASVLYIDRGCYIYCGWESRCLRRFGSSKMGFVVLV